jgi:hypothetical protein
MDLDASLGKNDERTHKVQQVFTATTKWGSQKAAVKMRGYIDSTTDERMYTYTFSRQLFIFEYPYCHPM